jgi:hypothetical protein
MRPALALMLLFLCYLAARAQAPGSYLPTQNPTAPPGPVPISEEPHHRLVLQNDFTRVYNVMVPALDATLLHQHDVPYLYVTLGPADLINAVVGKPELHQLLQDGETHYNPGHFAHLVRTESGVAFHNITIEFVRPQGTAKNLCKDVVPGEALNCPEPPPAAVNKKGKKVATPEVADEDVPYFESDEVRVELHKVSSGNDYVDAAAKFDALLVGLTNANLDANLGGEHLQFLHGGDVIWMPAGQHRRIVDFLGTHSSFLLITFKDGSQPASTQ